ncbi:CHAT domain-containing protein [Sinorhizobium meliloti]|uniref:CHAT domain-containing protein n=1 Tax=Rhizobium meliloti TaxID=382 RepID=UPI000FD50B04|nr:CHAT domain-containing protein [Sinorhizobium meliloti]RVH09635.1 CHAT domain-containing protein [Sinorhizobium meliloti]RVI15025.1 CHAT domain-containing protein [Sinorhizobium meliloti]
MTKFRPIAIAFQDKDLASKVKQCLLDAGIKKADITPAALRSEDDVRRWLQFKHAQLIVLDAEFAPTGVARDASGRTALNLLKSREGCCGRLVPALVITQNRNPISDLENFCQPENKSIALSQRNLFPDKAAVFKGVLSMIGPDQKAVWKVIEIHVNERSCKCYLGDGSGDLVEWEEGSIATESMRLIAAEYEQPDAFSPPRWLPLLHATGRVLFRQHIIGALGRGMFEHIEGAAGGLSQLAFRFRILDPGLYSVPFEANVRSSDEDPYSSEFVLLRAPVARWMPTGGAIRVAPAETGKLPPRPRLLFIRSQLCEHPDGETYQDVLDMGGARGLVFRKLRNIDVEFHAISTLSEPLGITALNVVRLNLSDHSDARGAIRNVMETEKFDIVHFAGHSWSSSLGPTGKTILVLPGFEQGIASQMPVEEFAELAGRCDARLIYLSSCQGSSARSVLSLVQHGALYSLGFRCDVDDERAALFAAEFYGELFKHRNICRSFSTACSRAHDNLLDEDESPIWISPILVAQARDWAV